MVRLYPGHRLDACEKWKPIQGSLPALDGLGAPLRGRPFQIPGLQGRERDVLLGRGHWLCAEPTLDFGQLRLGLAAVPGLQAPVMPLAGLAEFDVVDAVLALVN